MRKQNYKQEIRKNNIRKGRQKKKNMSIYIDGENISPKKAEKIVKIAQKEGELYSSRVYGLQKDNHTKRWSDKAQKLAMKDIRLCGGPQKNKVDKKLQKDILKEIREAKNIDIVCIVSSDHGYTRTIEQLRAQGKRVVCIGEKKTSAKLRKSCSKFIEI